MAEIAIVVAIVGVLAAMTIPLAVNTVRKQAIENSPQVIAQTISRGRDAARDMLRCVTVLVRTEGSGARTIGAYLHDTRSCAPDFIDVNDPGRNSVTVADITLAANVTRSLRILRPSASCHGTPPPENCYEEAALARFLLRPDGTTDTTYRIRLERSDGIVDSFLVFPETGTVRHLK